MIDRQPHKIVSGSYTLGGFSIIRNGRVWHLQAAGREDEIYPTRRLAILAARILCNIASDAESDEFRSSQGV